MSAVSNANALSLSLGEADLNRREECLVALIREAGRVARTAFEGEGGFEMKGPQDFLTVTDAAVEKLLREKLTQEFPEDGFVGEEGGANTGRGDAIWVVDPIDGTANFARRIPHYCISVALVSGTEILLGAIFDPAHDELYLARAGRGATRNGSAIAVSSVKAASSACVELGWSTRIPNAVYLGVLKSILDGGANVRRAATGALGLAYVADGRSDAYAELHMHAWDCLAGLLLVREAGGVVSGFLENGGLEQGGSVLASAPGVADLMTMATGIAPEHR